VYRGATASCDGFRSLRFRTLPLAGREASDVAAAFRPAAGSEVRVLTGPRATEAAFKRLAPGSAYVHLATHGFLVNDRCGGDTTELPLHLSGLALAGANRRAAAAGGEEDGILTAEEIASMDLSGVRWVALSACDTGVGPVENGEGVLGLRRAFAVAGARTLILALWRVDDRDARSYMRALYDARSKRGLDTPSAMREASLAVLRDRRAKGLDTSPLHWGGFAAAGDWR
jgi:CHAT domain-containing protein